jgi:hypothetical protein
VVTTGSKNGFVQGLPTHYIVYTENTPSLYQVYRFFLKTEQNDPTDPSPINLSPPGQSIGDVLPGSTDPRPTQPGGQYSNQLGFTIDTSYLAQHASTPQSIQTIQFNILTMNVAALSQSQVNQRVLDAIGNQSSLGSTFNNPIQVNINTSGTYTDQTSSVPEQANDTYPPGSNLPSIDLTSWSLTVATPS